MKYSSTEVTNRASITKKTLRHYNEIGILKPIIEDNGYWYYTEQDMTTLQLIQTLQVMGFSLKEIKENIDSDFLCLREKVINKKNYIREQVMQLDLATRLINKIEKKEELSPLDALMESFEEEHLEWYRESLPSNEYNLVLKMLEDPGSADDHNQLLIGLNMFKSKLKKRMDTQINIENIKEIFRKYDLDESTINFVLESFIRANLEGPLSQRILSIKEASLFLERLKENSN